MPEKTKPNLDNVAETLLIPLYTRAMESQRADGLVRDNRAVEIVSKLDCDFSRLSLRGHDEVSLAMRLKEFDHRALDFLSRNPDGMVVHIGCGLDTRFDRVDNGRVEWFDLDLPEVIDLRRRLIGSEQERYHLLSSSVFEDGWLKALSAYRERPVLFISEAVLPYFKMEQVKPLVLKLRDHFPGAELVCDAYTPFMIRMDNLHLVLLKVSARMQWGLKHAKDMELWGEGITLLDEWYYFDHDEPRMAPYRWMGKIPVFGKSAGIFHYRLGRRGG